MIFDYTTMATLCVGNSCNYTTISKSMEIIPSLEAPMDDAPPSFHAHAHEQLGVKYKGHSPRKSEASMPLLKVAGVVGGVVGGVKRKISMPTNPQATFKIVEVDETAANGGGDSKAGGGASNILDMKRPSLLEERGLLLLLLLLLFSLCCLVIAVIVIVNVCQCCHYCSYFHHGVVLLLLLSF